MEDKCICCGAIVPEGWQVCPMCIVGCDLAHDRDIGVTTHFKKNKDGTITLVKIEYTNKEAHA